MSRVGYNVQVAVDAKHKLIVEQQVTNQVVDMGLLAQTAEPAKEVLGVERIDVVADRGYFKIEDIEACEKAGHRCLMCRGRSAVRRSGRACSARRSSATTRASDSYRLPGGPALCIRYTSSLHARTERRSTTPTALACQDCRAPPQCTARPVPHGLAAGERGGAGPDGRPGWRSDPTFSKQRREIVEHPFGTIKQWMNQGAFLMRGLEKVRAEFSLTALAYNLSRVLNIVGFAKLMAAARA